MAAPVREGTSPDAHAARILGAVQRIPAGHVATYGQVAELAGMPRRARLVGRVLGHHELAEGVPWHRVIGSAGHIAARGGGEVEQRRRLSAEGVQFSDSGRIDLSIYQWRPTSPSS